MREASELGQKSSDLYQCELCWGACHGQMDETEADNWSRTEVLVVP